MQDASNASSRYDGLDLLRTLGEATMRRCILLTTAALVVAMSMSLTACSDDNTVTCKGAKGPGLTKTLQRIQCIDAGAISANQNSMTLELNHVRTEPWH